MVLLICSTVLLLIALYLYDEQVVLIDFQEDGFWPDTAFLLEDRFYFETVTPVKDFCFFWRKRIRRFLHPFIPRLRCPNIYVSIIEVDGQKVIVARKCIWLWQEHDFCEKFAEATLLFDHKTIEPDTFRRYYSVWLNVSYEEMAKVPVVEV